MFCPNCGNPCEDLSPACPVCGNALPQEPVVFAPPKKGSHLSPVIIMAVMLCIGVICFFLFPKNRNDPAPTIPSVQSPFELEKGILEFYSANYDGGPSLTVPDTIDGMPVLRIGESSFYDCDMLEEVILPNTVIELSDSAFEDCDGLRGIFIPETVLRIGSSAFAGCDKLEAVYLHDTIETIEPDAFADCDNLRHVFFDGTVKQWSALFRGDLPDSVTLYCEDGAFQQHPAIP